MISHFNIGFILFKKKMASQIFDEVLTLYHIRLC